MLAPATLPAASSDLLFGQQHSYTVTMRGNGESVVVARIAFTNTSDQPQKTFAFTVPGPAAPSDLVGYQQQYQQVCNRYGSPLTSTPLKSSSGTAAPAALPAILPCLEYAVPDYTQPIDDQSVNYQKLNFHNQGNQYNVTLPTPVPSQQSSSLLLSYATTGYTHRFLGAYTFDFQTLKVGQRISSTDVAVNVDSDQYLEGAGSVNYQATAAANAITNGTAPAPAALNQISDNLGQGGEINKSATDLAPGDTLSVKGRYASSAFVLRLPGLLTTLGFLVLVVVVMLIFRRRIATHLHGLHRASTAHAGDKATPAAVAAASTPRHSSLFNAGNLLAGLVSALGISGITWFMSWYGQTDTYNNYDSFTTTLILITVVLSYAVFGLGPAIYLAATSRDWRRLVFALTFEVLFLVAFVVIYVAGIAPLLSGPSNPGGIDTGIINPGGPNIQN